MSQETLEEYRARAPRMKRDELLVIPEIDLRTSGGLRKLADALEIVERSGRFEFIELADEHLEYHGFRPEAEDEFQERTARDWQLAKDRHE